jgi:phosphotransferase system HPr (HPr) family protein
MNGRPQRLAKKVHETSVQIKNPQGLHMRPAMQFVDLCNRFSADIVVSNGQTSADGKSIMQMSMLAATCGTRLTIRATGADADAAIESLRDLVEVRMFDAAPQGRVSGAGEG